MKLLKLIPVAAIASTALITPLKADSGESRIPSGWTQRGGKCGPNMGEYYKANKNSDTSQYGVWNDNDEEWVLKNVTEEKANVKMNNKCNTDIYQPTS